MTFPDLVFYLFALTLLFSAIVAVGSKNTIHSVLFLILAFFNAAGLFVLLKAEFLAMLLVIVYVGAIAVLFLFVVMMLNIDQKPKKIGFRKSLPLLIFFAGLFFSELLLMIKLAANNLDQVRIIRLFPDHNLVSNTGALGNILYTDFVLPFEIAGAILFVAMIGAIVLTLREQTRFIKSQEISKQVTREKSIELAKPKLGEGVDI